MTTTHPDEPEAGPLQEENNCGWFRTYRSLELPDLIKRSHVAFILATAIAYRTRWNQSALNPFHLEIGEAVCDYKNWNLTEQQFRRAKKILIELNIASFRATTHGTIARLLDRKIFGLSDSNRNKITTDKRGGKRTDQGTDGRREPDSEESPVKSRSFNAPEPGRNGQTNGRMNGRMIGPMKDIHRSES